MRFRYLVQSYVSVMFRPIFNTLYPFFRRFPGVIKTILYEARLFTDLKHVLKNIEAFEQKKLSSHFGFALSERIVELPWVISNMPHSKGMHLDAGSSLNFSDILQHPYLKNKQIIIGNINPERNCFWTDGISYFFGDLRKRLFSDALFDSISCVSVLEHVGMDNSRYTDKQQYKQDHENDYLLMIDEFRRILKPGGVCLITVPFGEYASYGWLQVFSKEMVQRIVSRFNPASYSCTYFSYDGNGWKYAQEEECAKSKYFMDYPGKDYCVGAQSVACIKLIR